MTTSAVLCEVFPLVFLIESICQPFKSTASWLAEGMRLICWRSFWRLVPEGFLLLLPCMQGCGAELNPLHVPYVTHHSRATRTCLMRAAACRRLLRSATSSWSCCHNFCRLSVCLRMSTWCAGFFWLRSQPLLITSAHTALCELHSASRAWQKDRRPVSTTHCPPAGAKRESCSPLL